MNITRIVILVALVAALVVGQLSRPVEYRDPRADPVPVVNLHAEHYGGPGCDASWTMPILPHVLHVSRPLGVGGTGTAGSGGRLRVVTLNAHHLERQMGGHLARHLAALIALQRPDIVVLQELDRGTARAGGANQAALVAKLLGMHYAHAPAMAWDGGEVGGAAVLSRWPIEAWEAHQLPTVPGLEPRAVVAARITPGDGLPDFLVLGTHLDHVSPVWRLAQARELTRLAEEADLPVILAGDMNEPRGGDAMGLLIDSFADAGAEGARIDHVLVRGWTPVRAWTVGHPCLDHPVLVSDLVWRTP